MRLLLDEHVSRTIAEQLRQRGHDVLAVSEAGLTQQPDDEVFRWATGQRRALVTADYKDFRLLHQRWLANGERHYGLVLVPRNLLPRRSRFGDLVTVLDRLLRACPEEDALDTSETWLVQDQPP